MEPLELGFAVFFYLVTVAALAVAVIAFTRTGKDEASPTPSSATFENIDVTNKLTADEIDVVDIGVSGSMFSTAPSTGKTTGVLNVTSKLAAVMGAQIGEGDTAYDLPESIGTANQVIAFSETGKTSFQTFTSTAITNDSDVTGTTLTDALNTLNASQASTLMPLQNAEFTDLTSLGGGVATVAYSSADSIALIGSGDAAQNPFYTTDGETFTALTGLTDVGGTLKGYRMAYSPSLDIFACSNVTNNIMYHSENGLNWTVGQTLTDNVTLFQQSWVEDWGMFVAVTNRANFRIAISTDGKTWLYVSTPGAASAQLRWFAYAPELKAGIAVGTLSSNLISSDGINWSLAETAPDNTQLMCAAWSPKLSRFMGFTLGNDIVNSSDGKKWNMLSPPVTTSNVIRAAYWVDELNAFFFGGDSGGFAKSTDGKTVTDIALIGTSVTTNGLAYVCPWKEFIWGGSANALYTGQTAVTDVGFAPTYGVLRILTSANFSVPLSSNAPPTAPSAGDYKEVSWDSSGSVFNNYLSQSSESILIPKEGRGTWRFRVTLSYSITPALLAASNMYFRLFNGSGSTYLDGSDSSSSSLVIADGQTNATVVTATFTGTFIVTTADVSLNLRVSRNDNATATTITLYSGTSLFVEKISNATSVNP